MSPPTSTVSDRTPDTQEVKYKARRAASVAQQNPLGLALGSVAVGVLAGMLIPSTRVEDEKLGEMSDNVIEKVKETGQEALEHGKQVAQDAVQSAQETAKESGQEHAQQVKDTAKRTRRTPPRATRRRCRPTRRTDGAQTKTRGTTHRRATTRSGGPAPRPPAGAASPAADHAAPQHPDPGGCGAASRRRAA